MRGVLVHLWREWREHRPVLLGIAGAIPFLTALGFGCLGVGASRWVDAAPIFVVGSAVLAALALSTELYAGDVSRGTFALTRRTPGGPARAFAGKALALVLAIGIAATWGGVSFLVALYLKTNPNASEWWLRREYVLGVAWRGLVAGETWMPVALLLTLSTWILLVSTWVPRGASATAGALLLLALLALPGVVMWHDAPASFLERWLRPWPGLPILFATALGLAAWCGTRALARPSPHVRAVAVALPAVLLCAGTAYGFAVNDWHRLTSIDPLDPSAVLAEPVLARGGRFAYANVHHVDLPGASRPIRIDLSNGRWEDVGTLGERVLASWGLPGRGTGVAERSIDGEALVEIVPIAGDAGAPCRIVDATRGVDLTSMAYNVHLDRIVDPVLERIVDEEARRRTPVRLSDGRRAWPWREEIRVGNADGTFETRPIPKELRFLNWATVFGWSGYATQQVYLDVDTMSLVAWRSGSTQGMNEGWSAHVGLVQRSETGKPRWNEIEMESGTERPSRLFADQDRSPHVLSRRTALVVELPKSGRGSGRLVRVDLTTGDHTPVTIAGAAPESMADVWVIARDGDRVVLHTLPGWAGAGGRNGTALYRESDNRLLSWTPRGWSFLGLLDDEHGVWLDDGARLVKVTLGTNDSTLLFGRAK
jgi:hypothetical protein